MHGKLRLSTIISFSRVAAILFAVTPIASLAAAKDVKMPACTAKMLDDWQHRSFTPLSDTVAKLPNTPCLMTTDTGAYICKQNIGCSRYNPQK